MRKEAIIKGLAVIVVIFTTSAFVPDSRTFTKPEPTVVETSARKVNRKVSTARYIAYDDEVQKVTQEDVVEEEVIVEEVEEEVYEEAEIEYEEGVYYDAADEEQGMVYLGSYEITAYEWTGNPCANGNYPSEWYTVASNYFDFGTTLYIDGVGYVVVEDRGASWHSDYWLDLYLGDVGACYEWGRQYRDVYLVN